MSLCHVTGVNQALRDLLHKILKFNEGNIEQTNVDLAPVTWSPQCCLAFVYLALCSGARINIKYLPLELTLNIYC